MPTVFAPKSIFLRDGGVFDGNGVLWRLGLGAATRAVPTRSGPALVTPERSQLPDSVGSIVAAPGSEPVYYMSGACLFVNRRVAGT